MANYSNQTLPRVRQVSYGEYEVARLYTNGEFKENQSQANGNGVAPGFPSI